MVLSHTAAELWGQHPVEKGEAAVQRRGQEEGAPAAMKSLWSSGSLETIPVWAAEKQLPPPCRKRSQVSG